MHGGNMQITVSEYELGLITSCLHFWLETPQKSESEEDKKDINQENADITVLLKKLEGLTDEVLPRLS
jgi:hypothetical protein